MSEFLIWIDSLPPWSVELAVLALVLAGFVAIDWAACRWPHWFEDQ